MAKRIRYWGLFAHWMQAPKVAGPTGAGPDYDVFSPRPQFW